MTAWTRNRILPLVMLAPLALAACQTGGQPNRTLTGAGIGAAGGAVAGAIIDDDERGRGALIGAGAGALLGGAVGAYMDNQQAQLTQDLQGTGATVQRQGDVLYVQLPADVTFGFDQYDIQPQFIGSLTQVASTLAQYDQTVIDVTGHTDSTGDADYNQRLSEERANSVANFLVANGVARERILARGAGENFPIMSNDTEAGRQANRRVEMQIRPVTQ